MLPPKRHSRTRTRTARAPSVGDAVYVWWDGEAASFRGVLARRARNGRSFVVKYDDGDVLEHDLAQELWSYAGEENGGRAADVSVAASERASYSPTQGMDAFSPRKQFRGMHGKGVESIPEDLGGRFGFEGEDKSETRQVWRPDAGARSAVTPAHSEWTDADIVFPFKHRLKRALASSRLVYIPRNALQISPDRNACFREKNTEQFKNTSVVKKLSASTFDTSSTSADTGARINESTIAVPKLETVGYGESQESQVQLASPTCVRDVKSCRGAPEAMSMPVAPEPGIGPVTRSMKRHLRDIEKA